MIEIGLLGFGTVGQGIVDIIEKKSEEGIIPGKSLNVKKVLVRDIEKVRDVSISEDKLTLDPKEILEDEAIDIIIEVTGEVELGYEWLAKAFKNKKHVVTANKALVSAFFEELSALAEENGVSFLYESSVGGAIPIIKPLRDQLRINEIQSIQGILNGTSNYILSKMTEEGLDYDVVLKEAQDLGYAEADPSSDVEGLDTLRKLRILSTLGLGTTITEDDILCNGINHVSSLDIQLLKERNMRVKLIGATEVYDNGYTSIVQPTALKDDEKLAQVGDAFNSVSLVGNYSGELNFFGRGAGMHPTANAILTDVVDCVLETQDKRNPLRGKELENLNPELEGRFYLRITDGSMNDLKHIENLTDEVLFEDEENFVIITKRVELFLVLDKLAEMDDVISFSLIAYND